MVTVWQASTISNRTSGLVICEDFEQDKAAYICTAPTHAFSQLQAHTTIQGIIFTTSSCDS